MSDRIPPERLTGITGIRNLDDAVIAARLDDLGVETLRPEDPTGGLFIEFESVGDDQWHAVLFHSMRNVSKERQRVPEAPSPKDRRRPEPRPNVDGREDPRRPVLPINERTKLVSLKLGNLET
jgi:hypothetical protein